MPLFLALVMLLASATASATPNHYVWTNSPSEAAPYTNWTMAAHAIQPAVDAAEANDTVWVTNGTYVLTNQITITNGITVRGVNGAAYTIVNGNYSTTTNRCFSITTNAVLDGLTISNGFAVSNSPNGASGGGVYLSDSGATIQNCTITGNKAYCPTNDFYASGGGIYVTGLAYVINCTISANTADSQKYDDVAFGGGGGLYMSGATATIVSNCFIFNNVSWSSTLPESFSRGGGVRFGQLAGTIANCTIYSNRCRFNGGGVYGKFSAGTIRNCIVSNNYAQNSGAGICIEYGGLVEGCLIVGNQNMYALRNYGARVRNCTIVGNRGGTFTWGSGSVFENVIVYYNTGNDIHAGGTPPYPSYFNCCALTVSGGTLTNFGSGNITNAPLFVDRNAGDYRLTKKSPCINAGTNRAWMTGAVDMDGHQRIDRHYGHRVDMGAYEFIPKGTIFIGH